MKISFIKYEKEEKYKIPQIIGINIEEIIDPDQVDYKIKELIDKQYRTIILSSELASFSDNIIRDYKNNENIKIIILP